jgi:hypothetical protein
MDVVIWPNRPHSLRLQTELALCFQKTRQEPGMRHFRAIRPILLAGLCPLHPEANLKPAAIGGRRVEVAARP